MWPHIKWTSDTVVGRRIIKKVQDLEILQKFRDKELVIMCMVVTFRHQISQISQQKVLFFKKVFKWPKNIGIIGKIYFLYYLLFRWTVLSVFMLSIFFNTWKREYWYNVKVKDFVVNFNQVWSGFKIKVSFIVQQKSFRETYKEKCKWF